MRAHRLKVTVPESHELRLRLPSDFPTGEVEVIVLEAQGEVSHPTSPQRRLTVDELMAARLQRPPGVAPVSLEDIERAIAEGGVGRGDV
ncbi:MAG TPA: hypothetical protein VHR45_11305 [Thermoanaerobaculia bacterium]|nr:hypothetical protein [Thermoanaerobaculia bacterium]